MTRRIIDRIVSNIKEIENDMVDIYDNLTGIWWEIIDYVGLDFLYCYNCTSFNINALRQSYCCPKCIENSECCADWCKYKNKCKSYRIGELKRN